MSERAVDRRQLLHLPSEARTESGLVIPSAPQVPEVPKDYHGLGEKFLVVAAILGAPIKHGRRLVLAASGAAAVMAALSEPGVLEAAGLKIVEIKDYTPSRGEISYPWIPYDPTLEGRAASGLNEGGLFSLNDAVDVLLNGDRGRARYWQKIGFKYPNTPAFAQDVFRNNLNAASDIPLEVRRRSAGMCWGATAAAEKSPDENIYDLAIKVGNTTLVIPAEVRRQAATIWHANLEGEQVDIGAIPQILANGERIALNHSTNPYEEWWVLGTHMEGETIVATKYANWWERNKVRVEYRTTLKGVATAYRVLDSRSPDLRYVNIHKSLLTEQIAGIFIGKYMLVDGAGNPKSYPIKP